MKLSSFTHVVKIFALVLILLFFAAPLVRCTHDTSLNASGWNIASGTGDLKEIDESGKPLVFALMIIPVLLLLIAFEKKPFKALSIVALLGLAAEVIFLISLVIKINSGDYEGHFELTGYNWLVLAIYIGLCAFTRFCRKIE